MITPELKQWLLIISRRKIDIDQYNLTNRIETSCKTSLLDAETISYVVRKYKTIEPVFLLKLDSQIIFHLYKHV